MVILSIQKSSTNRTNVFMFSVHKQVFGTQYNIKMVRKFSPLHLQNVKTQNIEKCFCKVVLDLNLKLYLAFRNEKNFYH